MFIKHDYLLNCFLLGFGETVGFKSVLYVNCKMEMCEVIIHVCVHRKCFSDVWTPICLKSNYKDLAAV